MEQGDAEIVRKIEEAAATLPAIAKKRAAWKPLDAFDMKQPIVHLVEPKP